MFVYLNYNILYCHFDSQIHTAIPSERFWFSNFKARTSFIIACYIKDSEYIDFRTEQLILKAEKMLKSQCAINHV